MKGKATYSSILAWRILAWVTKNWAPLSDFHFLLLLRPSNFLAFFFFFNSKAEYVLFVQPNVTLFCLALVDIDSGIRKGVE